MLRMTFENVLSDAPTNDEKSFLLPFASIFVPGRTPSLFLCYCKILVISIGHTIIEESEGEKVSEHSFFFQNWLRRNATRRWC